MPHAGSADILPSRVVRQHTGDHLVLRLTSCTTPEQVLPPDAARRPIWLWDDAVRVLMFAAIAVLVASYAAVKKIACEIRRPRSCQRGHLSRMTIPAGTMSTRPCPAPARRGLPCRAHAHRLRGHHAHAGRRGTPRHSSAILRRVVTFAAEVTCPVRAAGMILDPCRARYR